MASHGVEGVLTPPEPEATAGALDHRRAPTPDPEGRRQDRGVLHLMSAP